MGTQTSLLEFVNKKSIIVALLVFLLMSSFSFMYAQNSTSKNNISSSGNITSELINIAVTETIPIVASILGLGVTALAQWIRKIGVPLSNEQEAKFREIVTNRFEKLAKDSWSEMRGNPEMLSAYWEDLKKGHVPEKFQENLRKNGYEFAMELKQNKEFRDFAKNITDAGMKKLLKDLRTNLKNGYQQQMLDVIPNIASVAVDSAFDPNVSNVEAWSKNALENLKPLLLSTEALDNENNLMIIIKAEINKRLQKKLVKE
jgi:hypothetical protein